jgi:hypothetical protein
MLPVAPRFAISAPWRGANHMKLRAADGRLALHSIGSSHRRYHQPENDISKTCRCRDGHPGFVPSPAAITATTAPKIEHLQKKLEHLQKLRGAP